MSAPAVPGYLESGDSAERQEDPTQNKIIRDPSNACAQERQASEQSKVARLGVHSRSRLERGSNRAAPPCARVDGKTMSAPGGMAGHLSGSDRATRCP